MSRDDPFRSYECELLDLVRTTGKQRFPNASAFAKRVSEALRSHCRARVLAEYALSRAKQERALVSALNEIKPRRTLDEPWQEPPDAFDAVIAAISALGLQIPVRVNPGRNSLSVALAGYAMQLAQFTRYRTNEPLFDVEGGLHQMIRALAEGGWPKDLISEAESEIAQFCNLAKGVIR